MKQTAVLSVRLPAAELRRIKKMGRLSEVVRDALRAYVPPSAATVEAAMPPGSTLILHLGDPTLTATLNPSRVTLTPPTGQA